MNILRLPVALTVIRKYELLDPSDVTVVVEQDTVSRITITASSPRFLVETFHALRQRVVDYVPHVVLVYSHTECYCSTHHLPRDYFKKVLDGKFNEFSARIND